MPRFALPNPLQTAVFIAGACLMSIEILASRLVAPVLGTSVLVWTNLIGIILFALACGAWFGGFLADRRTDRRTLGILFLLAGIFSAFLVFTTRFSLWVVGFLPESLTLPLVALVLLAPPAFFLGAVGPFAVRLGLKELNSAGHVAGRFSALGTLGSLLGTYLTGYVLLAHFSTPWILNGITLVLYGTSLWLIRPHFKHGVALGLIAGTAFSGAALAKPLSGTFLPSPYSAVRIATDERLGKPVKLLWMDNTVHGGVWDDGSETSYFDYYPLFERLTKTYAPDALHYLAIGGGTFHGARSWLANHPDGTATVIERDPAAIQAAHDFFGLKDDLRLTVIEGDGRASLRHLTQPFDAVLVDAYADRLTIPWHLITKEAWAELATHLSPNAFVAVNLILHEDQTLDANRQLIAGITNAAKPNFAWQKIVHLDDHDDLVDLTNTLLVMGNGPEPSEDVVKQALTDISAFREPVFYPIDASTGPAFDDAFAPVEFLTMKLE